MMMETIRLNLESYSTHVVATIKLSMRDVEWWLVDIDDVVKSLEKPVQEKVTGS